MFSIFLTHDALNRAGRHCSLKSCTTRATYRLVDCGDFQKLANENTDRWVQSIQMIPQHRCTCVSNTTFWFVITIIDNYCFYNKDVCGLITQANLSKILAKSCYLSAKIPTGEWANVNIPSLAMQYLFCQTFRKLKYKDTKKIILLRRWHIKI